MPEHFLLDTGGVTVIGPAPLQQHRTCVSGQLCDIRIDGHLLADGDTLMVLGTCGSRWDRVSPSLQPNLLERNENNVGSRITVTGSGAHVSWDTVVNGTVITAYGGEYRLCWCAGSMINETAFSPGYACTTAEQFRTDLGEMSIIGPSSHMNVFIGTLPERLLGDCYPTRPGPAARPGTFGSAHLGPGPIGPRAGSPRQWAQGLLRPRTRLGPGPDLA